METAKTGMLVSSGIGACVCTWLLIHRAAGSRILYGIMLVNSLFLLSRAGLHDYIMVTALQAMCVMFYWTRILESIQPSKLSMADEIAMRDALRNAKSSSYLSISPPRS